MINKYTMLMKKVLSFDISSTTIGYSVIEYSENNIDLISHGNIKPPKSDKGSLSFRALSASRDIRKLLKEINPDEVAVEAYAQRFSAGRSTARTIIVLSFFNELISMIVLDELGFETYKYPVITIRTTISKFIGVKTISKENMFDVITKHFSNFTLKKNKTGKTKEESFDESDAIAVGFCHSILKLKNK